MVAHACYPCTWEILLEILCLKETVLLEEKNNPKIKQNNTTVKKPQRELGIVSLFSGRNTVVCGDYSYKITQPVNNRKEKVVLYL